MSARESLGSREAWREKIEYFLSKFVGYTIYLSVFQYEFQLLPRDERVIPGLVSHQGEPGQAPGHPEEARHVKHGLKT